jgi:hypothetical protein
LAASIHDVEALACLVGPHAHTDPWVDWEVRNAIGNGKGLVAVRLRTGVHDFMPMSVRHSGAQIVDAHLPSVIATIERTAFVKRVGEPRNK